MSTPNPTSMESMDKFFKDFHQQVKGVMYNVEAAVVSIAQPEKKKRATTTVRQPFMLATPDTCDTERLSEDPDCMIGVWYYGEAASSYEIFSRKGKLMFREGKRQGEIVASADGDWKVASLKNAADTVVGSIKLRYKDGKMESQFRSGRSTIWGEVTAATKEEISASKSEHPLPHASSSQSRCMTGASASEQEVKKRKHAKTALPQELHFVAPQDCVAGKPVCLLGPHGDPITVPLPEGAEPGKACSVYLGPKSSFKVIVPEGALPGAPLQFTTEDGEMLNTIVQPGKKPGDTMEIVPPVVLVQVPKGVKSGDEVTYTTPIGTMAMVQVPEGFAPGHYFTTLLPSHLVPPDLAKIAMRAHGQGASQPCDGNTVEQDVQAEEDKVDTVGSKTYVATPMRGHRAAASSQGVEIERPDALLQDALSPDSHDQLDERTGKVSKPEAANAEAPPSPVKASLDEDLLTLAPRSTDRLLGDVDGCRAAVVDIDEPALNAEADAHDCEESLLLQEVVE